MDERAALSIVGELVDAAGDDVAILDGLAVTVDMLHASSDYPEGVTPYTAGWRVVSVSLSDLAAVGATPMATLSVYSPPRFEEADLRRYLEGAIDASAAVGAEYVGGDLDITDELTTVSVALGRVERPIGRGGATPGDAVVVTGELGRGAVAVELFEAGAVEAANEAFRIEPRVATGQHLAEEATAMIDSSDGLIRSLYHLAEASECGFEIDEAAIPIDDRVDPVNHREHGLYWGEDFELVATLPAETVDRVAHATEVPVTQIGTVVDSGITLDGEAVPDRGYDHA